MFQYLIKHLENSTIIYFPHIFTHNNFAQVVMSSLILVTGRGVARGAAVKMNDDAPQMKLFKKKAERAECESKYVSKSQIHKSI